MISVNDGNAERNKSANAFKTISEVAHLLNVPQHVLRFWETKFIQIKPMKRAGGRRYYRPEDVELLSAIRRLLHAEGYTIRGVQKKMREKGIKSILTPLADPSQIDKPGLALAAGEVMNPTNSRISEADKAELSSIRDDLITIRSTLVGSTH